MNELQSQYEQQYGPGNYIPDVRLVYWSMRVMAYLGDAPGPPRALGRLAAPAQAARRRDVVPARGDRRRSRSRSCRNFAGWILTEAGRQPWVVYGLLKTEDAVSGTVSAWTVGLSLAVFASLYAVLGVGRLLPHAPLRPARPARGRAGGDEEAAPEPAPAY